MPSLRVCLAAFALCLLLAAPASAATTSPSLLFVQQADGGTLHRIGKGVYRLTFRGVSRRVSSFSDRPGRTASVETTRTFVSRWGDRGFAADPPNAALVLDDAPAARDTAMLTLSRPRYDATARTLTYTARALSGDPGVALRAFTRRRDPIGELRFGRASLFIDDGASVVYEQIQFEISNLTPGQKVSLQLTPIDGGDIAFSSGTPLSSSDEVRVSASSAVLPLLELSMSEEALSILTTASSGASSTSFTVTAYLAGSEGMTGFYLRNAGDSGVQVLMQLGDLPLQSVGSALTMYPWDLS